MTGPVVIPETLTPMGRWHLWQAVTAYIATSRNDGKYVPPELDTLVDALLDPTAQCAVVDRHRAATRRSEQPHRALSSHVDGESVVTYKDAARRLAVSVDTVGRMVARGDLSAVGAARRGRRIVAASISEYMEGRL